MREHGEYRMYAAGCRCEKCKNANRLSQQVAVARLRSVPFDQVPHGTLNAYANYACRCEPCKAVGKRRNQELKARLKALPFERKPHGTERGYTTYGCRCDPCRVARASARKKRMVSNG